MKNRSLYDFCQPLSDYLIDNQGIDIVCRQGNFDEVIHASFGPVGTGFFLRVLLSMGQVAEYHYQNTEDKRVPIKSVDGSRSPSDNITRLALSMYDEMQSSKPDDCAKPIHQLTQIDIPLVVPSFLIPLLDYHSKLGTLGTTVALFMSHFLGDGQLKCANVYYQGSINEPIFFAFGNWSVSPGCQGFYHINMITTDFVMGGSFSTGYQLNEIPLTYSWGQDPTNAEALKKVSKMLPTMSQPSQQL